MKVRMYINMLLALLLLVSNTGLAFNVHYCEGKISGISFNYQTAEPCLDEKPCEVKVDKSCCAVADTHDSCCENSKVDIKKTTTENILIKSLQLDLPVFLVVESWRPVFNTSVTTEKKWSDAPAFYWDTHAPPLYKLYSQYLFYDAIIS